MRELLPTLDAWFESSDKVALATVTGTWGSAPRGVGAHMIVSPEGAMAGSVSGGCVEGAVVEAALDALGNDTPRMLEFGVADELAWDVGLTCGGRLQVWVEPLRADAFYNTLRETILGGRTAVVVTVLEGPRAGERLLLRPDGPPLGNLDELQDFGERAATEALEAGQPGIYERQGVGLFVQPYLPPSRLIVIGAVHTAIPLVTLGRTLGYSVTVVDARAAFATKERFPDADQLLVKWPDNALDELKPDANTAVVVLSHDPKFDEPALTAALASDAGYIGAIGSRATSADRLVRLRGLGYTTEQLERIHGPIGLDIGASTPAEIALSILAEVVAERHNRTGGRLRLLAGEKAR